MGSAYLGLLLVATVLAGAGTRAAAETLDSVVASVGNVAITARDVNQEYRFERFLDGQWPPPPPDKSQLAAARERLTDQIVLTHEENPEPHDRAESEKAAALRLDTLRKAYAHAGDFQRTLEDLGMTEAELRARITQQELMLRLIDQRLRPAASPRDDQIADYYHTKFVPEFQEQNHGASAPPLSEVKSQIREILVQKRINELLEQWIEDLKPTTDGRFHSF